MASLVAWGGVGKSALINRWLEGLAKDEKQPWGGAGRVYAWSFYSQGSHENSSASADLFIDQALRWFGDPNPAEGSPWDKGERLANLIRQQKTLLVLDGLEPLQWATGDTGRIKDPALATLVEELARNNTGLCLITTRQHVTGLEEFPTSAVKRDLLRLPQESGRALLRVRGARGSDADLERMSEAFGNHALAVSLLATWLRGRPPPHLEAVLTIPDRTDIADEHQRHPRRILSAFADHFAEGPERQLFRLLGLFDRPATKAELVALLASPPIPGLTDRLPTLDAGAWNALLDKLRKLGLVAKPSDHNPGGLDAHPLSRERIGKTPLPMPATSPNFWRVWAGWPRPRPPPARRSTWPRVAVIPSCARFAAPPWPPSGTSAATGTAPPPCSLRLRTSSDMSTPRFRSFLPSGVTNTATCCSTGVGPPRSWHGRPQVSRSSNASPGSSTSPSTICPSAGPPPRPAKQARRIANRGEMRLHLIDCDLEQARLTLAEGRPKEEDRPYLERARKDIAETGYHRRDREVRELGEASSE